MDGRSLRLMSLLDASGAGNTVERSSIVTFV